MIRIKKFCIDCGKEIDKRAKRCFPCSKKSENISKEHKKKISEALKGRKLSKKQIENISKALKGRKKPKEFGEQISKAKKGRTWEDLVGIEKAKELKKKMSESHKGKKPWNKDIKGKLSHSYGIRFTEERRRNISKSLIGKKLSKERIEKMRKNRLGTKRTEEAKRKTSESLKKRQEKKPWGFIKGHTPHNKGQKGFRAGIPRHAYNGEFRKKISEINKNRPIEIRKKISATMQGINLEEWEKFISFEPYTPDFNKYFRETIKRRDNDCCMLCHIHLEDLKLLKRKLCVHHIDYNKKNSFPQNCIILCNKCHCMTNYNRNIWIMHFQALLKKLYNYRYTQDQKIILEYTKGGKQNVGISEQI